MESQNKRKLLQSSLLKLINEAVQSVPPNTNTPSKHFTIKQDLTLILMQQEANQDSKRQLAKKAASILKRNLQGVRQRYKKYICRYDQEHIHKMADYIINIKSDGYVIWKDNNIILNEIGNKKATPNKQSKKKNQQESYNQISLKQKQKRKFMKYKDLLSMQDYNPEVEPTQQTFLKQFPEFSANKQNMNLLNELAKILKKGSIYDAANFLRSCSYDQFLVKQILEEPWNEKKLSWIEQQDEYLKESIRQDNKQRLEVLINNKGQYSVNKRIKYLRL